METVLITGGSRGIGLELTKQFLDLGYRVISTYRVKPSDKLSELKSNKNLSLFELEVTDESSIKNLVKSLDEQVIDILINNAGVIGPSSDRQTQDRHNIDVKGWLETFAINSIAPLMISNAVLGNLKKSNKPRILTVSSQMGSLSLDSTGMYAYRSSKAAVNKVMQVLSVELKSAGVAVCVLHPGWVKTDMGGSSADISVEESASGIVDLAMNLTMKKTGKFFNWNGTEHAW